MFSSVLLPSFAKVLLLLVYSWKSSWSIYITLNLCVNLRIIFLWKSLVYICKISVCVITSGNSLACLSYYTYFRLIMLTFFPPSVTSTSCSVYPILSILFQLLSHSSFCLSIAPILFHLNPPLYHFSSESSFLF